MKNKRLLKLADLLDEDAKNKKGIKFDMYQWGRVKNADHPVSCGTHACALGFAALTGKFKGLGASISPDGRVRFKLDDILVEPDEVSKEIFGLTEDQFKYLFIGSAYLENEKFGVAGMEGAKAERRVAKRIRRLVKNNGKIKETDYAR